eukprot:1122495-Prymnesium_polylepis.1
MPTRNGFLTNFTSETTFLHASSRGGDGGRGGVHACMTLRRRRTLMDGDAFVGSAGGMMPLDRSHDGSFRIFNQKCEVGEIAVKSAPWAAALRAAAKSKSKKTELGPKWLPLLPMSMCSFSIMETILTLNTSRVQGTAWRSDFVGVNIIFTPHTVTIMRARSGVPVAAPGASCGDLRF